MDNLENVRKWFGAAFNDLHPELQAFHVRGGILTGNVFLKYGTGLAGIIGRKIGNKLGLPNEGEHPFSVNVRWQDKALHWDRSFKRTRKVNSIFEPFGTQENGYWIEKTGKITIKLTVEIIDGGWHWKTLGYYIGRLPLPHFLFPTLQAYKKIDEGCYLFHVSFSYPLIGQILSYQGKLKWHQ